MLSCFLSILLYITVGHAAVFTEPQQVAANAYDFIIVGAGTVRLLSFYDP